MKIIDFIKSLPHVEPNADYLNSFDYYPFLNSLAKDFEATRVLEIGVRFGYSAVAFIYNNPVKEYVGIDYELYEPDSLTKGRENLEYLKNHQPLEFILLKKNTQNLTNLSFLGSKTFDLIHIDGDHSYEGALTDLKNFWNVLMVGGHMLVDDSIFYGSVNTACIDFVKLIDEPNYNVKSFRGTWVFLKTREKSFSISKSVNNEITESMPISEANIFKAFIARHTGWNGRLVLLKDGTFKGGSHNPDGQWKIESGILKLEWYHWPTSVLKSNGSGSYFSVSKSDNFTLHEEHESIEDVITEFPDELLHIAETLSTHGCVMSCEHGLLDLVPHIMNAHKQRIPGAVVECGTWRGGCLAFMGKAFEVLGDPRPVWGFDSFEGLPRPEEEHDGSYLMETWQEHQSSGRSWCAASEEEFKKTMDLIGLEGVHTVKGFFSETFPVTPADKVGPICILRLDSDWYASQKMCLEKWWDNVVPGGVVISDDYHVWSGDMKAFDEFLQTLPKGSYEFIPGGGPNQKRAFVRKKLG